MDGAEVDKAAVTAAHQLDSGNAWTDSPQSQKKRWGINTVRLKWKGRPGNIDIYRDRVVIATTPNDGLYDTHQHHRPSGFMLPGVCLL
jgi:hypothetical protein